jgi:surfeit locus 1 family protein
VRRKIQILPLLFIILAFFALLSLGFWQISRLKEKELFISSMQYNLSNPPVDLKTLSANALYARIKVKGHFLADKNIHLYGRKSMSKEKDGYYLITPFQTSNDKIILVTRGWFAQKHKNSINDIVDHSTEISGVTLPSEKNRLFVPGNDIANNIWFTLDLQQASQVLGLNLENFYLIMDSNSDNPSQFLKILSTERLLHIRNDHLEYAVTWFALAIALAVISIVYYFRQK